MDTKFNKLIDWWEKGHEDELFDWGHDTFEEAHRIFGADYEQSGGDVYVGIVGLVDDLYAVFTSDSIKIIKTKKLYDSFDEIIQDGNSVDIFVKYVN